MLQTHHQIRSVVEFELEHGGIVVGRVEALIIRVRAKILALLVNHLVAADLVEVVGRLAEEVDKTYSVFF